jgi:Domain of unknown function (DUF4864)
MAIEPELAMRAAAAVLLACLSLALAEPARALNDADRAAIRDVIQKQLDAFAMDDGARAYSFAAPSIQNLFPSQERFMGMVREGYKPVYRHRSALFGSFKDEPDEVRQSVYLQDLDGEDWLAIYAMEAQPDGSWRISGCTLQRRPGQAV